MLSTNQLIQEITQKISDPNLRFFKFDVSQFSVEDFIRDAIHKGLIFKKDSNGKIIRNVFSNGDLLDFSMKGGYFDFHTDDISCKNTAKYVLLYCVHPGKINTPTILIDSVKLSKLLLGNPITEKLAKYNCIYIDKSGDESIFPLINYDDNNSFVKLASRGFIIPKNLREISDIPSLREMSEALNQLYIFIDQCKIYEKKWGENEMLLFDNLYCLHGRPSKVSSENRHLLRLIFDF